MPPLLRKKLKRLLEAQTDLELAVLIGSQTKDDATPNSDWDIAIRWVKQIDSMKRLGKTEMLRRLLAKTLNQPESKIDLIDLTMTRLTMNAVVAEEGEILKGEDTLAWNHFLQRTWRELETYYWSSIYAN